MDLTLFSRAQLEIAPRAGGKRIFSRVSSTSSRPARGLNCRSGLEIVKMLLHARATKDRPAVLLCSTGGQSGKRCPPARQSPY